MGFDETIDKFTENKVTTRNYNIFQNIEIISPLHTKYITLA
jgi:hypothetical protein